MDRIVSDFSKVKVGDVLWDLEMGDVRVIRVQGRLFEIDPTDSEVEPVWRDGEGCMTSGMNALCFWSRPEFIVPPPPKRKVKREREIFVNIYSDGKHYAYDDPAVAKALFSRDALAVAVRVVVPYEEEE